MAEVAKEALEFLVEQGKKLVPVEKLTYGEREYTIKDLKPVQAPLRSALKVSTLRALIDLCQGKFGDSAFEGFDPNKYVVHVVGEDRVQVVSAKSDNWARREVLIDCNRTATELFPFGQFLTQEQFIIKIISCCVQSTERDYVAKLCGNALAERIGQSQDDGVSQTLSTKHGAHMVDAETIRNIVPLCFHRTFTEVPQPETKCLIRLKQASDTVIPTFALFEADGGKWRIDAIENVARHLRASLKDATVAS
jgi:hypothetical protein